MLSYGIIVQMSLSECGNSWSLFRFMPQTIVENKGKRDNCE